MLKRVKYSRTSVAQTLMAVSNSFLSPFEQNPIIAHLGEFMGFSFLYGKNGILFTQQNLLNEVIIMRTHNIPSC